MYKEGTTKVNLGERDVVFGYFAEVNQDYSLGVDSNVEKVDIYETYIEITRNNGDYHYVKLNTEEDLIELVAGSKVKVMWWNA